MKRIMIFLFTMAFLLVSNVSLAINDRQIHEEARFIADKIAYQFGLDRNQLGDAYEINYDFLKGVYAIQDDLLSGNDKAITKYYALLDVRNTDLLWLMDHARYSSFVRAEALFRPVYISDGAIRLRIYDTYDKGKFLGKKPKQYLKYNGGHSREKQDYDSYYKGRYRYIYYGEQPRLLDPRNRGKLAAARKADFGQ